MTAPAPQTDTQTDAQTDADAAPDAAPGAGARTARPFGAAIPKDQLLTFLYTYDLPGMVAFYRDVMGLRPVIDQGAAVIFQVNAGAYLGVCDLPHRPRGTQGVMVTFVRDVDAEYARLSALGVAFEGPPALMMDGTVYAAFFRDPQGYHLEIQEFRNPDWDALFTDG